MAGSDPLDQAKILQRLNRGHFIERIFLYDRVASTNTLLKSWAEEGHAGAGVLVAAEEQTAGQGRLGRPWHSAPGRSLTFSFLCLNPFPRSPGKITLGVALAAAGAIERETGVRIRIKWPNDLYAGAGKLAGILARPVQVSGGPGMVVGIGINVNAAPSGLSMLREAHPVCLKDLIRKNVDRSLLLASILNEVDALMNRFARGEVDFLVPLLRARSLLLGGRARIEYDRKAYEGIVLDHTEDMGILIDTESGRVALPGESSTVLWFEDPNRSNSRP